MEHLLSERTLGLVAKDESTPTHWIAIDLDLHLAQGGNIDIVWQQVEAVVSRFWTVQRSQIVVSNGTLNGIHLYLYPQKLMPLDVLTGGIRGLLQEVHEKHPEISRQVDEWNAKLAVVRGNKVKKVAQIADLELYPSLKNGFRFLGLQGKVVLAHRDIGRTVWGLFKKGPRKGQRKYGFDVMGWWDSLQKNDRLPLKEILDYIRNRLPPRSKQMVLTVEPVVSTTPISAEAVPSDPIHETNIEDDPIKKAPAPARLGLEQGAIVSDLGGLGPMRGSTRYKLPAFWLGTWNPRGTFESVVVMTARLFAKEGLSKEETKALILKYAHDLPEAARQCSSRLKEGRWKRVEQDISKAVDRLYAGNANQQDIDGSNVKLNKVVTTWAKYGFRLSDKSTWVNRGVGQSDAPVVEIEWLDEDRDDFRHVLMPSLHVKDLDLAEKVASAIVQLTLMKEREQNGWGYKYLEAWLPAMFDIPCSKKEKQQQVFQAFQRLKIIKVSVAGKKGRATQWTLGDRAKARIEGSPWVQESRDELEQSWEEGQLLLDWNKESEKEES